MMSLLAEPREYSDECFQHASNFQCTFRGKLKWCKGADKVHQWTVVCHVALQRAGSRHREDATPALMNSSDCWHNCFPLFAVRIICLACHWCMFRKQRIALCCSLVKHQEQGVSGPTASWSGCRSGCKGMERHRKKRRAAIHYEGNVEGLCLSFHLLLTWMELHCLLQYLLPLPFMPRLTPPALSPSLPPTVLVFCHLFTFLFYTLLSLRLRAPSCERHKIRLEQRERFWIVWSGEIPEVIWIFQLLLWPEVILFRVFLEVKWKDYVILTKFAT